MRPPDGITCLAWSDALVIKDLAEFLGHPTTASGDRRELLSPREREVYDLLVQGLKNREIARLLFIEESTVKVHAHHIYDKLGIRSQDGANDPCDAGARGSGYVSHRLERIR